MSGNRAEHQNAYNHALVGEHQENFYKNNNYDRLVAEYSSALAKVLHEDYAAQLSDISTSTITDQKLRVKGEVKLFQQGSKYIARTNIPSITVDEYEFQEKITVDANDIDEVIREVSEHVAAIFAERVVLKKKIKKDMGNITHFKKIKPTDQLSINY